MREPNVTKRRSFRVLLITVAALTVASVGLAQAPNQPERTPTAPTAAPDEPEPLPPGHPPIGDDEPEAAPDRAPAAAPERAPAAAPDRAPEGEGGAPEGDPHAGLRRGGGGGGDEAGGGDPHGRGGGRGGGEGIQLPEPPPSSAEPDRGVPPGVVRVTVVDAEGRPLANERVELGTLGGMERRERVSGTTRADGTFEWRGLATGSEQAYRASVVFQGARFAAEPFQLPPDRGYRVRIGRTGVTRSGSKVLLFAGRTTIEVRDERLVLSQSMQLVNFDEETWVLPTKGVRIGLPPGFTAFQNEPSMSDLRVSADEHGAVIAGSVPPGESRIVFGYHVPYSGGEVTLSSDIPFRTVIYEVLIEAARGMTADVEGFPELQELEDDGRRILGARLSRRPGSPELDALTIHLRGIPGPGAGRWVALVLAVLTVGGAIAWMATGARASASPAAHARTIEREKAALLDQIEALEREHAAGAVGPKTYARRREELVRELASLLREARAAKA